MGKGPLIILLHGWPETSFARWLHLLFESTALAFTLSLIIKIIRLSSVGGPSQ
jgi:hypothetical protein